MEQLRQNLAPNRVIRLQIAHNIRARIAPDAGQQTEDDHPQRVVAWGLDSVVGGDDSGWNSFSGSLISVTYEPVYLDDNTNLIVNVYLEDLSPTFDDGYNYMD